jgi:hypothetical protein
MLGRQDSAMQTIDSGASQYSAVTSAPVVASGNRPVSLPENPNAPSLLNLPGEMRNHIYGILFKMDRPVQLVVRSDGNGCGPVRDGSEVVGGASLLGTCRQIYSEAAGVLYAQNTFNVTNLHDTYYSNCLVEEVGSWLTKVGHQSSIIGAILLDIDGKKCAGGDLEVFPVLRHLCKAQNAELSVTFKGTCMISTQSPPAPLVDVTMLNKAIDLLKQDALLNIMRYAPFPQLKTSVYLSYDGLHGKVAHPSENPDQWNERCEFDVAQSSIQQRPIVPLSFGLECLLDIRPIRNAVLQHALPEFDEFVYDLSDRTLEPDIPGILGVNSFLRDMCLRRIRADSVVTALKTIEAKLTFSDQLALLKRFPSWKSDCTAPGWHWLVPNKVVMKFEMGARTKLSDLRIDAIALFEATKHFEEDTRLSIELSYMNATVQNESLSVRREVTMSLFEFQNSVVTVLIVFAEKYPDHKNKETCPAVWMDGYFLVRETEHVNSNGQKSVAVTKNSPEYLSFIAEIGRLVRPNPRHGASKKSEEIGMSCVDRFCLSLKSHKPVWE